VDAAIAEEIIALVETLGSFPGQTLDEKLSCDYLEEPVIDSMGLVQMITELEVRFDIRFEASDLQSTEFRTLAGVAEIVKRAVAMSKDDTTN
jgi:acyl carrier protein